MIRLIDCAIHAAPAQVPGVAVSPSLVRRDWSPNFGPPSRFRAATRAGQHLAIGVFFAGRLSLGHENPLADHRSPHHAWGMCNLYNISTTHEMMRQLADAISDLTNRRNPNEDIYPDQMGTIIRNNAGEREIAQARWGLPGSPFVLKQSAEKRADKMREKGKPFDFAELLKMEPDRGVTNVRNTSSRHWQRWLGPENRCLVPLTKFAEPNPAAKAEGGRTPNAWFALSKETPLACFAGIWVPQWESVRKVKEGLVKADLYGFLTCDPNGVVGPIHQKAMPVILTKRDEIEAWLTAPWSEASALQRPLPDDDLVLLEE